MSTVTVLRTATTPRVDLLPEEIHAQRHARRIQVLLASAVVGALAVVGGLYLAAVSDVDGAQLALEDVQAEQETLQRQTRALADVPQVYADVAATEGLLSQATQKEVRWSYFLNDLSLAMPENVWLKTMTASTQADAATATSTGAAPAAGTTAPAAGTTTTTGTSATARIGTVTFTGTAFRHEDVAEWLEMLAQQPGYADAYFTGSTQRLEGTREVVDFTSEVVVTDAALWDNYLKATGQ